MWQAIILVKGNEPKLYETPSVIDGLFLNFTTEKMKGPNKTIQIQIQKLPVKVNGYQNDVR